MPQTLFKQTDAFDRRLPSTTWGRYERYNQIIGGIKLVQTRSKTNKCVNSDLDTIFCREDDTGQCCHDERSSSKSYFLDVNKTRQLVKGLDHDAAFPDIPLGEGFEANDRGEYEFWLLVNSPIEKLRNRIIYLANYNWVDLSTWTVRVEGLMYNGELGLFAKLEILFTFLRGGSVRPSVSLDTVQSNPYRDRLARILALDTLFVVCFLFFIVTELREL
ncbi:unnamed protein product [Vitrella brassicaformis CCMP3155]|uniref:Polycystin domain-containing protein n=1 Tax=Vitrella brassicaformis (strain CCMP3155) TaxID=1169540 RepID=A0A0G4ELI7_VITBC|nr:unnamed protein product [Vitrella brassicaformis CCMP3155]|eukprot:CEL97683.1 unnamed protein product [Vitrella brassicaformis CCMP3155]